VVRDRERRHYFERHLAACLDALREGAPLHGYFAWSLLDNFEWAEGFDKRFGLVHVDFETPGAAGQGEREWYRGFLGAADRPDPAPVAAGGRAGAAGHSPG
jgi:beta-glucosidase